MQDYRRLHVWRKAHALTLSVHRAANEFPKTGYGSLRSQMIRSAESITFNIVEGCGAASQKEMARFLDISIKSTTELEYQLRLAKDYEILPHSRWQLLSHQTIEVRRMLYGLRAKVLSTGPSASSVTDKPNDSKTVNSERSA
jgi:four helix bundle protein